MNLIKYAPLTVPLIPLLRLPERQVNLIEYAPLMKINWLVGRDADRAQQVGVILFVAPSDRIQGAILLPLSDQIQGAILLPLSDRIQGAILLPLSDQKW